jgi:hypothetical protein
MLVGNRLRELRESKQLSQRDIQKRIQFLFAHLRNMRPGNVRTKVKRSNVSVSLSEQISIGGSFTISTMDDATRVRAKELLR